jgi:ketosteroid isomerase-like protein
MSEENVNLVQELFHSIEQGHAADVLKCYDPAIVIRERSDSLPNGGVFKGRNGAVVHMHRWAKTWGRSTGVRTVLDATFMDAGEHVLAIWHHLAEPPGGIRLDTPVVGLYTIKGGRITEAEMFHADTAANPPLPRRGDGAAPLEEARAVGLDACSVCCLRRMSRDSQIALSGSDRAVAQPSFACPTPTRSDR